MPIAAKALCLAVAVTIGLSTSSACSSGTIRNRANEMNLPPVMLWAWERPEDLRFLNSSRYGVAVLAQTLVLKGGQVIHKPRRQPLLVASDARVIAVTRIESQRSKDELLHFSRPKCRVGALIAKLCHANVSHTPG